MTSDTTGIRVVLRTGDIVAGAQAGSFGNPRGIAVQEEGGLVVTEAHTAPRRLTYGAPAITSITPQTIDSRGGETVTVKGRNFSSETIVVLAGTLISSAQVRDTGTIIFRAPKLPSGKATLTLQNRGGIGQAPIVLKPVPLNALDIGAITTIAGSSTFAGDGGPANQSGLDLPQGVAVDESGNVYIADTNHDRVRKIDRLTGIITTIAGTGQNRYDDRRQWFFRTFARRLFRRQWPGGERAVERAGRCRRRSLREHLHCGFAQWRSPPHRREIENHHDSLFAGVLR